MARGPVGSLPEGRAWLERLPLLVDECRERWSLELEAPFADGWCSVVFPAGDAVLKICFPHRESEHEAAAVAHWNGDGAVRLLKDDPGRHALLLERCRPGTPLSHLPVEEALDVAVSLVPRLFVPAARPFRRLSDEAERWAAELIRARHLFDRELVEHALSALAELPQTQGDQVLVSEDLHAGNILEADREPWLAIDPKPLVGEREFGVVALVRGDELGESERELGYRLDRLTSDLGLDRERTRLWTLAHTLAWSIEGDGVAAGQVEIARRLATA